MQLTPNPRDLNRTKCLILVGGDGDTPEGFVPLVEELSGSLPTHTICTITLASDATEESLLDLQARELEQAVSELATLHRFESLDYFATSMGAYAMVKLLVNKEYMGKIGRVILFDPADYYISSHDYYSWTGAQEFAPTEPVVSDLLKNIPGNPSLSVVHLTLRNYNAAGYIDSDYSNRGINHPSGSPRLNAEMVKGFYAKTPAPNRGQYLEVGDIPHAILRDGNINQNIQNMIKIFSSILR